MIRKRVFHRWRSVVVVLALTLTISAATGCRMVTPQIPANGTTADVPATTKTIPILVKLDAKEGEALAAAQRRVMGRLRSTMQPGEYASIRVFNTLPLLALRATPELIAFLLTLADVSSVEADRVLAPTSAPRFPDLPSGSLR